MVYGVISETRRTWGSGNHWALEPECHGWTGPPSTLTWRPVLPLGETGVNLTVTRVAPGQATTIPLTVVDECGAWPTFVGGGPSAF
jgi:hypothetical protein